MGQGHHDDLGGLLVSDHLGQPVDRVLGAELAIGLDAERADRGDALAHGVLRLRVDLPLRLLARRRRSGSTGMPASDS